MAHQNKSELLNSVLQLITEEGTGGLAEGLRLLINEAMLQERSQALQAQPYERTDTRQGCHRADQNRPLVGTSKPASLRREIHNSFLIGFKECLAAS